MSQIGNQLMNLLASSVRAPSGVEQVRSAGGLIQQGGGIDFARLLSLAQGGRVQSGLPVTVDPSGGLEFDAGQIEQLSAAADRAQASGATHAIAIMDGIGYRLDVETRTITGVVDLTSAEPIVGIDAIVRTDGDADTAFKSPPAPGGSIDQSSLLNALASSARAAFL